jgi:p-aminobenzoyl-glutamate transporter AbgT
LTGIEQVRSLRAKIIEILPMPPKKPASQPLKNTEKNGLSVRTAGVSVAATAIVLLVAIIKARPEDIPKIVETIFGSNTYGHIGWTLAIVFLISSAILIRIVTNTHQREIDRLSTERSELQRRLLGDEFPKTDR